MFSGLAAWAVVINLRMPEKEGGSLNLNCNASVSYLSLCINVSAHIALLKFKPPKNLPNSSVAYKVGQTGD